MKERRREPRYLLNFRLNFSDYEAETIDISPSGMGLFLNASVATNERISFSLLLPNQTMANLEGIVKWQTMVDERNYCGIEFIYPDQEIIEELLSMADQEQPE